MRESAISLSCPGVGSTLTPHTVISPWAFLNFSTSALEAVSKSWIRIPSVRYQDIISFICCAERLISSPSRESRLIWNKACLIFFILFVTCDSSSSSGESLYLAQSFNASFISLLRELNLSPSFRPNKASRFLVLRNMISSSFVAVDGSKDLAFSLHHRKASSISDAELSSWNFKSTIKSLTWLMAETLQWGLLGSKYPFKIIPTQFSMSLARRSASSRLLRGSYDSHSCLGRSLSSHCPKRELIFLKVDWLYPKSFTSSIWVFFWVCHHLRASLSSRAFFSSLSSSRTTWPRALRIFIALFFFLLKALSVVGM